MGGNKLVFVLALAACGGGTSSTGGVGSGGRVGDHLGPSCSAEDYSTQITAICKRQHPPPPAAGAPGAACGYDVDCASGHCVVAGAAATGYCTAHCSATAPCPNGLACQSTWCVQESTGCSYAGYDTTSCVTTLDQQANFACTNCDQKFASWLACVANAGRLCSVTDAHTACGIERGQLESCCPSCSSYDL